MHFVGKNVNFHINAMNLRTYYSVDAEIWSGNTLLGDKKICTTAIFDILIFDNFSGSRSPKLSKNAKNLNFDPLKNREKSKFQCFLRFSKNLKK